MIEKNCSNVFCITKDGKRIPEVDCDNHEITISIKDIKRIIREQPTVNTRTPMSNIVEKLEHSKEMPLTDCGKSYNRALDLAINIVKQEINNGLE